MMRRFIRLNKFILLLLSYVIVGSCNSNTQVTETSMSKEPVLTMKNPVVKSEPRFFRDEVKYRLDSLSTTAEVDSLLNTFSEDQLKTVLAINRIEKRRLRPERPIVVPECASALFNTYSPFPENINFLQCIPKTVLISQRVQAFGLYEKGKLVRWGPVSTGKSSTRTPNGLNYGNYKAKRKVSTVNESWILPYYFNFMNFEGVGVHQYVLPGYPASHGCVRLYMDDAKYVFNWAEMWEVKNSRIKRNGTPFMVFGDYDYAAEKPWLDLSQNMKANDLTQAEINTLQEYVVKYQEDPRNSHNLLTENTGEKLVKM